jgi:hypothetical protein
MHVDLERFVHLVAKYLCEEFPSLVVRVPALMDEELDLTSRIALFSQHVVAEELLDQETIEEKKKIITRNREPGRRQSPRVQVSYARICTCQPVVATHPLWL